MRLARRSHKYGAQPTVVDGIRFASKAESRRYQELKLLEKAGEIEALELQPKFPLVTALTTGSVLGAMRESGGIYPVLGTYRADFKYFDLRAKKWVVEDVKGTEVPLQLWKRRHAEAQYGITVQVIRKK